MFGLLYSLFGIGARGIAKVGGAITDEEQRTKAKNNGALTFWDCRGKERWVQNGHRIYYANNSDGDRCYFDAETGSVLRNIDEEYRIAHEKELTKNGEVLLQVCYQELTKDEQKLIYKRRINPIYLVRHVYNRQLYQKISINNITYYKNCNSGLIDFNTSNNDHNIITIFNTHQKELINKANFDNIMDNTEVYGYHIYTIGKNGKIKGR